MAYRRKTTRRPVSRRRTTRRRYPGRTPYRGKSRRVNASRRAQTIKVVIEQVPSLGTPVTRAMAPKQVGPR